MTEREYDRNIIEVKREVRQYITGDTFYCNTFYFFVLFCLRHSPRGGFSYRRYRRSPRAPLRGGRKKLRPAKKKQKKNKNCVFFFCAPFYISNQYFDMKKKNLTLG